MSGKSKAPTTKKKKINFEEILTRYQTGQYSITQLAKEYGIAKSHLSVMIKKQNTKISEHTEQAISHLHTGFKELALAKSEQNGEQLVKTALDIIQEKNPIFAQSIQVLASKLLKKSVEMVEISKNANELQSLATVMQKVNDTLQVIPKVPQTQINIQNQNANIQNNTTTTSTSGSGSGAELPPLNIININTKKDLQEAREIINGEIIE